MFSPHDFAQSSILVHSILLLLTLFSWLGSSDVEPKGNPGAAKPKRKNE
jgi:hypothetical protein